MHNVILEKIRVTKNKDKPIKMSKKINFNNNPEEIHFKAIEYFQEIKKRNDQIYDNYNK